MRIGKAFEQVTLSIITSKAFSTSFLMNSLLTAIKANKQPIVWSSSYKYKKSKIYEKNKNIKSKHFCYSIKKGKSTNHNLMEINLWLIYIPWFFYYLQTVYLVVILNNFILHPFTMNVLYLYVRYFLIKFLI